MEQKQFCLWWAISKAPKMISPGVEHLINSTFLSPHIASATPMGKSKKTAPKVNNTIATNKKARFEYFIEARLEAGICLEGWEVKSLRDRRVQLGESYVSLKNGEAWLLGAHISPLPTASTHISPNPTRTRKLLLNRREISALVGAVERKGYTVVPLNMYWKQGRAKLEIGTAKGKKQHDKRASEKERDWNREKGRLVKHLNS